MVTDSKEQLRTLLREASPQFWPLLSQLTMNETQFTELLKLSNFRKKGLAAKIPLQNSKKIKIAFVGAYSFFPLSELLEQYLFAYQIEASIFLGDFDNYNSEILDENSAVYNFKPDIVIIFPNASRCRYMGSLLDPIEKQKEAADQIVKQLTMLSQKLIEKLKCEVFTANFLPLTHCDLGAFRHQGLGGDHTFRTWVNLHLGLASVNSGHILDLNFLVTQLGSLKSEDPRAWFASKQIGSPELLVAIAREIAYSVQNLKHPSKKVLVMDLDDTLWGGVIGDDGMDGIEIGSTSPRGEAYLSFQNYILGLQKRGILLGVCSKNDFEKAIEPFEKHPEMILKKEHIVNFKANWNPKSENIKLMAKELNLGLDSFVFVDDNPAEIEIVRQFLPEVATILLDGDPADNVGLLQKSRYFQVKSLTKEDLLRTEQYQSEVQFNKEIEATTDIDSFLRSLNMQASISEFKDIDVPRISQLSNKSNQFNLTTKRRTEAEIKKIMESANHASFTVRLKDKFADHGLISVVICEKDGTTMVVDTWLMSCRVLRREVEEEIINEIFRLANRFECNTVIGVYIPTNKNQMVEGLYQRFKFTPVPDKAGVFIKPLKDHHTYTTKIEVLRRAYE